MLRFRAGRLENESIEKIGNMEGEAIKESQREMIHGLIRKCESAEREGAILSKMVDFEMNAECTRNEEFMKTYKILKEVDYAESSSLALLYAYMRKDHEEFHV